jgi:hypothetical protein
MPTPRRAAIAVGHGYTAQQPSDGYQNQACCCRAGCVRTGVRCGCLPVGT